MDLPFPIIMATGNKSLKAQLRQANNLGVRYAVIIGEEEVRKNTVLLRDMTTAQQKEVRYNRKVYQI